MPWHYMRERYEKFVRMTCTGYYIRERFVQFFEYYVSLAIGTAVAQPLPLGGQINAGKKKSHKVVP